MKKIVAHNHQEASAIVAEMVNAVIEKKPAACLGLATGSSMEAVYERLAQDYDDRKISFRSVTTVNLDEYVGLPDSHPQSYRMYMDRRLFDRVDIEKAHTYIPRSTPADLSCQQFRAFLEQHPRDLQLLGVGANGHIGFNEPDVFFESQAHIVNLNDRTREDNSRFFDSIEEVPTQAITMGIGDIMKAEKIVMLIHGTHKTDVVRELFGHGRVLPECPCTVLKLHRDASIVITEDLLHTSLASFETDEQEERSCSR